MASCRLPWIITNGLQVVLLVTAIVFLMVPTQFKRVNSDVGQRITWSNLLCNPPAPNINITEDDVHQFWQIPRTARLSPRMIESGRCIVGVQKRNEKRPVGEINDSVCYCVDNWWVPVIAIVGLCLAVASLIQFLGMVIKKDVSFTKEELRSQQNVAIVRCFVFTIIGFSIIYSAASDSGFTYTIYGDVYPTKYFGDHPLTWQIALYHFVAASFLQVIEALSLVLCGNGCGKNQAGTNTNAATTIRVRVQSIDYAENEPNKALVDVAVQTDVNRQCDNDRNASMFTPKNHLPSPTVFFTTCDCMSVAEKSESASRESVIIPSMLDGIETDVPSAKKDQCDQGTKKVEIPAFFTVCCGPKQGEETNELNGTKGKKEANDGNGDVKTDGKKAL